MSVEYKGKRYDIEKNKKGQLSLDLSFLRISDISKISGFYNLRNLEVLDLRYNDIVEIKGLENLTNLQELYLSRNKITEIKGLETLSNLRKLNLGRNKITEIKNLTRLKNLREINLAKNQITEIKGLEEQVNLQKLDLNSNRISEVKGLNRLKNLEELNLLENQIYVIKGFESLMFLSDLYLGGNPVWKWAKKQFGEAYRFDMIKDPQALVDYCKKGAISILDEEKIISTYHRRRKKFLFYALVGILIMSIGPLIASQSIFGWVITVCGVIMVVVFINLAKLQIFYKLCLGFIGLFITICGGILIIMRFSIGWYILIDGVLWIIFCTNLWIVAFISRSGRSGT